MSYSRVALFLGVFGLIACSKAIKPLPDKNTNWLKTCDADAECGSELACLCGACTKACESDAQCGRQAPGAKCLAAGDPGVMAACGPKLEVKAVCSAECKRDSDCDEQAEGLRCSAGLCVPEARSCDPEEKCPAADCAPGFRISAACDASGRPECSCVPTAPAACEPGDVIAKTCDMECPELNEHAFATCGADRRYGPCTCQDPKCGPATDCAAGSLCYGLRCVEAPNFCPGGCTAGETCMDSLCVQVLVDGLSSPGDMGFSADGNLYFVNNGTYDEAGRFLFDAMLARIPLAPARPYERLREDLNEIGRMVVTSDAAYWFNVGDGIAFQVTGKLFEKNEPTSIFLTDHAESPLVADDGWFYWLERKAGTGPVDLMRASRAIVQPEAEKLLELPEPASTLALTGERLYWGAADSGMWSANKDGSDVQRVVQARAELGGPFAFVVDGAGVYWSWTRAGESVGLGHYDVEPDIDQRLTEGMSARLGDVLAVDENHVYWVYAVSGDTQYGLARTSKVPFSTEVLWRSPELRAATRILVRDEFMYVSTLKAPGQGKILRIQRARLGR